MGGKGFTVRSCYVAEMSPRLGVGVDIGATRMRVCIGRADGRFVWRDSRLLPAKGTVDDYIGRIVLTVKEAIGHVLDRKDLVGIGVASIGPLDLRKGEMSSPANLPYKHVPIVGPLREEMKLDVTLINDARAAALGEKRFGAGKAHDNLVYLTISTGIGGGAIVDGHLLVGKDGNAGEVGHITVDPEGRLTCGCGRKGHWEAYCSGKNIPRLASVLAGEDPATLSKKLTGRAGEKVDSALVLRKAAKGNRFAKEVSSEMGRLNAYGVANLVNMYDPSLITVGGGVALNNQRLILNPLRKLVPKHAINRVPEIKITPLGDNVGLMGALSLSFG
jgi:glucokinase